MSSFRRICLFVSLALIGVSAWGTTVKQMDLSQLTSSAAQIYRGTVVGETPGFVNVAGGRIPTVKYRILVEESIRGTFQTIKGVQIAEIQVIGKPESVRSGAFQRVTHIPGLPKIEVGGTYLFLTTAPSRIGLSTTVGLGQGLFQISSIGKNEFALNETGNVGLFAAPLGASGKTGLSATSTATGGPILYRDLAQSIRTMTGGR